MVSWLCMWPIKIHWLQDRSERRRKEGEDNEDTWEIWSQTVRKYITFLKCTHQQTPRILMEIVSPGVLQYCSLMTAAGFLECQVQFAGNIIKKLSLLCLSPLLEHEEC